MTLAKGFNLIGYATSPLGLGEDLRSFASILNYLKISFSVIDLPTDSSGKVSYNWEHMTLEDYQTSIFFMSPMSCHALFKSFPDLFTKPKNTIGYFLWELPDLPDQFIPSLKLVKHVWCPTKFVQKSFMAKSKQLTLCLPLPVIQPPAFGFNFREHLEIPNNAFVVLYMFDMHSTINRKNPQACMKAFIEFAKDKEDAYLILKINRWQNRGQTELDWLVDHPNVKLVTETLMPGHLVDLYQAANCYLSMHRSEGFGRTLVEALQNDLALITTNYSGPEDFINDNNTYLIGWQARKVLAGEYPHSQESTWSEPSIADAVMQLQYLYDNGNSLKSAQALLTGRSFQIEEIAKRYEPIIRSYLV
jgi:glycosyltransferase involved in cell wall biosynthesis